jgi:hypothetical protein
VIGKRVLWLAFIITALPVSRAQAQNAPLPAGSLIGGCATESAQSSCVTLGTEPTVESPADRDSRDSPGEVTLFRNLKGVAQPQTDIARTTASFGATWRIKTGLRYDAPGGLQFSASTIARRGYALPLAMVQTPGSDVQLPEVNNAALELGSAPTQWDTELRVRKTLSSKGPVHVAIVGEAFNLLNLNHESAATPGPTPSVAPAPAAMLTSPTFRVALVLSF